jgi:hypothetical protein
MAPSFRGCPVIFVPEHHNDSDKDSAFNFDDIGANPPSGIVTGLPTWGDDGWQWVDMLVWDEAAAENIDNGFSVSCAYLVDDTAPGGKWHDLLYDEEITNGHYMHMAIVPRPRYEGSQILANSKGGAMALFGFGGKKDNAAPPPAAAVPEKKPEEQKPEMLNADATVDVNGTPVPLYELIEQRMMKKGAGNLPPALKPEDMIAMPDGEQVSVADLIADYVPGAGEGAEPTGEPMENAEPPQDVKGEPPNDPAKMRANSKPEPKKPVVNAALKNAATNGGDFGQPGGIDSEATRIERGKARYSLPVKQGGE